jgi:hypothetical protein
VDRPALIHLARRFVGSLGRRPPSDTDEVWARSFLLPGESALWSRMSNPDRRHSVGVAREAVRQLCERAERPVVAAALLHDVGKVQSRLGTFGRVGATLAGAVAGRDRFHGRIGDYLRHDELGSHLLEVAGSDPLTVTWTREHHLPPDRWSLDPTIANALKAADDD